jgi:protein gp37
MPIFADYPVLHEPVRCTDTYAYMRDAGISAGKIQPYPFGFLPTFYRYKLDEPQHWKKPRNVFVCSMADLFGHWVPDEWIAEVLKACDAAPQHRYLFLTKAPSRYEKISSLMPSWEEMYLEKSRPVMMFGASATDDAMMAVAYKSNAEWVSVEPILEPIEPEWFISSSGSNGDYSTFRRWEWVVIGAETGKSKHRTVPNKEWVEEIAQVCKKYGTPVFMKDSLRDLMKGSFRQEFPWEVSRAEEGRF